MMESKAQPTSKRGTPYHNTTPQHHTSSLHISNKMADHPTSMQDIVSDLVYQSFPTITVTQRPHADREPTCGICFEDFQPQQVLLQHESPCNNSWHADCLLMWINQPDRPNPTCPACRQQLRSSNDLRRRVDQVDSYIWVSDLIHPEMIVAYLSHFQLMARGVYVADRGWITTADLPDQFRGFPLFSFSESFPAIVTRQMVENTASWESDPELEAIRQQGLQQGLHPSDISSVHFDYRSDQLVYLGLGGGILLT